jgi:hypothetical protein
MDRKGHVPIAFAFPHPLSHLRPGENTRGSRRVARTRTTATPQGTTVSSIFDKVEPYPVTLVSETVWTGTLDLVALGNKYVPR